MTGLNLTKEEIIEVTERKYCSAQRRQLERMGIFFKERGDGFPVVSRGHYLKVMQASEPSKPSVKLNLS